MRRLFFVAVLGLAACVTKREMRDLPSDAGNMKTYDAPFNKVKLACEDTMSADYWKKSDSDKDTHYLAPKLYQIIGTQNISSGTAGWRLRIRIEDQGAQCTVRVVVRSKVESHEAGNTENVLAEDLQKKIGARIAK